MGGGESSRGQGSDLDEVFKEVSEDYKIGRGFQKRPPGIELGMRHPARAQEIGGREAVPEASNPSPAKLSKTIAARLFQFEMS